MYFKQTVNQTSTKEALALFNTDHLHQQSSMIWSQLINGVQCWVSYFLKVTCYSYRLLYEKVTCYIFSKVTCDSYCYILKATSYFTS